MTPSSLLIALIAVLSWPVGDAPSADPVSAVRPSGEAFAFSRLMVEDGDAADIEVGVWRPQAGDWPGARPMVVVSHGNGGDFRSHQGLAEALAGAGFVVVSLTHTGDNWRDQSRATDILDRPRQLAVVVDHMVRVWEGRDGIDPGRIGAFGFSAGGFTVLTAAGGRPEMGRIADHCGARPAFFDCRLIASRPPSVGGQGGTGPIPEVRIRAVVVAAPALGFTFTPDALATLTQPVQLWQAGKDAILPAPHYAEPVRDGLPLPPEFHLVEGAGHFDFLAPCSPELAANAPMICAATPRFDRAAFHLRFNQEVIRFFTDNL